MLLVLALRFKRHIACFFYLVFYAQWVVAAEIRRHDPVGSSIPTVEYVDVRLPRMKVPENNGQVSLPDAPDSSVVPGHSGVPLNDIKTSPGLPRPA